MFINYQGIMVDPEHEQIRLNERDVTILPTGEVLIKSEIVIGISEVNGIFGEMAAITCSDDYEDLTTALDRELSGIELWDMVIAKRKRKG